MCKKLEASTRASSPEVVKAWSHDSALYTAGVCQPRALLGYPRSVHSAIALLSASTLWSLSTQTLALQSVVLTQSSRIKALPRDHALINMHRCKHAVCDGRGNICSPGGTYSHSVPAECNPSLLRTNVSCHATSPSCESAPRLTCVCCLHVCRGVSLFPFMCFAHVISLVCHS